MDMISSVPGTHGSMQEPGCCGRMPAWLPLAKIISIEETTAVQKDNHGDDDFDKSVMMDFCCIVTDCVGINKDAFSTVSWRLLRSRTGYSSLLSKKMMR
jgi:hypothetical protein